MADVVNFLYTTDIKLELTNIGVVVAVSRELDITTLVNVCGDFLIKTCEPDSILLYYSVAANNDLKFAQEGFEGVIASSLTEVADHKYFLNLPYQRLVLRFVIIFISFKGFFYSFFLKRSNEVYFIFIIYFLLLLLLIYDYDLYYFIIIINIIIYDYDYYYLFIYLFIF